MKILPVSIIVLAMSSCHGPVKEFEEPNNIRTYLSTVAEEITNTALSEVGSLTDWEQQRPGRYKEFIEMMGLQDMPLEGRKTGLDIHLTGTIQEEVLP